MNETLKAKYRDFFKDGQFKPCHILYLSLNTAEGDVDTGKFDYVSIAKFDGSKSNAATIQKYREEIIERTGGLYEFICAVEEVLDGLTWEHGDKLRRKYAKGETIRSEISKRALDNFIRTIEESDLYDFETEGERQLDKLAALSKNSLKEELCANAVYVVSKFRNFSDYNYMEHFFEFREKFKPLENISHKEIDCKIKDYGDKVGIYAIKPPIIYNNETRQYHLMEGNRELITKETPAFVVMKGKLNLDKLHITETVIGNCVSFGKIVTCYDEPYGDKTLFAAMPVEEPCAYYELIENGKVIKKAKEPVFVHRKKPGAKYNIRICLDESEMAIELMLSKDLHVGKRTLLEKHLEAGSGSEMYFLVSVMEAFKKVDPKGHEKMMAFRRSKDSELIKKRFGTLSFLMAMQMPVRLEHTA